MTAYMLLLLPIAALALLYGLQDKLILQPGVQGESDRMLASNTEWSRPWYEQGEYRGNLYEPAASAKGTVILYHGNAGTVDDREFLASALTSQGFRAVLVEYPGYGRRGGGATVHGALSASLDEFLLACANWPQPLYVIGESFGAGVAAEVVRRHGDRIAGVILFTPWDSLVNVVNAMFSPIPLGYLLRHRFNLAEALAGYSGSIVIVAAAEDSIIPVPHARALAKALPAAAYLEIPEAGHNDWPSHLTAQDWNRLFNSMTGRH